MSFYEDEILPILEKLKVEKDELKVQFNLAKMELREELKEDWHAVEEQWQKMMTKKIEVENSMEDTAENVKEEVHKVVDELKIGLKKIKDGISK